MHIDWIGLLQQHGYWAVFIGAFFEGETVMMLGAYAVHQHWLQKTPLILAGALAGFLSDQMYYQLGLRQGKRYLQPRPKLAAKFHKASQVIEKHPTLTILLMRFAVGFRIILPLSFGIRRYHFVHYLVVDGIACLLWAAVVATIGFKISQALHHVFTITIHHNVMIAALFFVAVMATCIRAYFNHRKKLHHY